MQPLKKMLHIYQLLINIEVILLITFIHIHSTVDKWYLEISFNSL